MTVHRDIEHFHDAIEAMSKTLTTLEQKRDRARARYEEIEATYQGVSHAIAGLREEMALLGQGSPTAAGSPTIDLRGCTNMGQRLHEIAMAMGGQIDIPGALDVIVGAGVTNAKRRNIGSDVRKWIKQHTEDWEYVAAGTYRYLRFEEGDTGGL